MRCAGHLEQTGRHIMSKIHIIDSHSGSRVIPPLLDNESQQREQDRLYRLAKKKGFLLQKCRIRDRRSPDYGTYRLIVRGPNADRLLLGNSDGGGCTLDLIGRYLKRCL